ncbi:MAG: hypothetical protein ABIR56_15060 [Polaromonas sp.]
MRIISFSNASAQPLLALPTQAMAPWITRLKNALNRITISSTAPQVVHHEQQTCPPDTLTANDHSTASIAPHAHLLPCSTATKAASRSSLRVVREVDSGISPDCAGRMVISGRIADVCAELDRMALRASAAH